MAASPKNSKTKSSPPRLHGGLLVDEILTRLPVAAAVRFRAVCKEWHAALTSDHFVAAHAARATAARQPEIVFFSPTRRGTTTTFYVCSLPADGGARAPRELLMGPDTVHLCTPMTWSPSSNQRGSTYSCVKPSWNTSAMHRVAYQPCEMLGLASGVGTVHSSGHGGVLAM
jgi:hypothetical protein